MSQTNHLYHIESEVVSLTAAIAEQGLTPLSPISVETLHHQITKLVGLLDHATRITAGTRTT